MQIRDFKKEAGDIPVLAEFWAPWCGYCRRIAPVMEQLKKELSGSVKIEQINIDDHPALAEKYNVDTIPTLIMFGSDSESAPLIAPSSKAEIVKFIKGE